MDFHSMCRLCFTEGVRMQFILNTHLQVMYESLIMMPFKTEDRPVQVCYICCTRLQNCYKFRTSCLRSEDLLTQMLNGNEHHPQILQARSDSASLRIVHPVVNLSVSDVPQSADSACKAQFTDMVYNVKIEPKDTEDNKAIGSTYDIPLAIIKKEPHSSDITSTSKQLQTTYMSESLRPPQALLEEHMSLELVKNDVQGDMTSSHAPDPQRPMQKDLEDSSFSKYEPVEVKIEENGGIATNNFVLDTEVTVETNEKKPIGYGDHEFCLQPYQCNTCSKCFSDNSIFRKHIRTHTSERPYQCNVCKISFTCNSDLRKHIRFHTGEKPYQCNVCKKCFSAETSLNFHIRSHTGVKPHQCHVCKKSFRVKGTLSAHLRTHTGDSSHRCGVCGKGFSGKSNLSTHMRKHTGEKPHQCNVCNKSFTNKCNLIRHSRTHTGEKPYQCDICQKSFTDNSVLIRHARTHTGEKPYECDVCKKSFTAKSDLIRHIRIHSGEKPHQCHVCKKSFLRKSSLRKHIRLLHAYNKV